MELGIGSVVKHSAYGEGVVIGVNSEMYNVCFIKYGIKPFGKEYKSWEVLTHETSDKELTYDRLERSLRNILLEWNAVGKLAQVAEKWKGGTLILKPHDENLSSKEIPIDIFFNKIIMIRDRLRVMEQRINSSNNLDKDEKLNLQQYLTRIYGSLTTFNVLFEEKEDRFVGEKTKL